MKRSCIIHYLCLSGVIKVAKYFLHLEKSRIFLSKSISRRIPDEKAPNKLKKLDQFKHNKMDFALKQTMTYVVFEKLIFFKVITNFVFNKNK